jgi:hypothetical protein
VGYLWVVGVLWAALYSARALRERNRKRRGHLALRARPERPLAEIVDGELVRVRGVSLAEGSLVAPLSGRPCIGYCVSVEEREDVSGWRRIGQLEEFLPFRLATDGLAFHVEGPFLLALRIDTRGDRIVRPSLAEKRVLWGTGIVPRGFPMTDLMSERELRLCEARVEQEDVIWVSGRASIGVDPRGARDTLRDPPMKRVIRGTSDEPTVLADDLGDRVRDLV